MRAAAWSDASPASLPSARDARRETPQGVEQARRTVDVRLRARAPSRVAERRCSTPTQAPLGRLVTASQRCNRPDEPPAGGIPGSRITGVPNYVG